MYPVKIDGTSIVLRDFEPDDLDQSMAVVGDPAVTDFLSFDTRTREQQAERLAADIERARSNPRPDYYLAIVEKDIGTLIGFVRIGLIEPEADVVQRSGELGAAIRKDRWRYGYAREAAELMVTFGFDTLGLHRIQARCGPSNTASQAGLLRLGFKYEAHLRDDVFTNGEWRDSLQYAILDHEWRSRAIDGAKPE
jgi:ribosomal-protein-alanine N-acetyltransferase